MKKSVLLFIGVTSGLLSTEFQFGSGTFSMEGGFMGLSSNIDNDVASFAIVNRHTNVGKKIFYSYDFNWFDSQDLIQAQKTYNNMASNFNIPQMEYRVKGLDSNIKLGYDIIHKNEDNFLGLGVLVGFSIPWVDSTRSSSTTPNLDFTSSNSNGMQTTYDMFQKTKTKIMTYKIGPTINFQKTLINNKLSIYGIGSYAYQTGYIKNDYIKGDLDVDGTFQEYGMGLYFTPFTEKFKWGWLTLSPRIYATLGYKYSKWDMGEVAINIAGKKINSNDISPYKSTFEMSSSIGYFGIGYSF